jgi:hypothetical protein
MPIHLSVLTLFSTIDSFYLIVCQVNNTIKLIFFKNLYFATPNCRTILRFIVLLAESSRDVVLSFFVNRVGE